MKTKKTIKGRVMYQLTGPTWKKFNLVVQQPGGHAGARIPVLVLPLDDLDGLVEQVAADIQRVLFQPHKGGDGRSNTARAVLSSLGVRLPKQRKAKS